MEFPVYQILTAELAHLTGLSLELSGRLVGLMSGALGLVFAARALFLAGLGNRESAIAFFFIAISPMYFYWSHAVMIETLAFMLSMAVLLAALEFTERGRLWPLGLGALCAILAALAKSTTFGVFAIMIFVIFGLKYLRFAWESRTLAQASDCYTTLHAETSGSRDCHLASHAGYPVSSRVPLGWRARGSLARFSFG